MADLASAHLRGTSARWQTLALGFSNLKALDRSTLSRIRAGIMPLAAASHLLALTAIELQPSDEPPPFLLVLTGVVLVLLALRQRWSLSESVAFAAPQAGPHSAGDHIQTDVPADVLPILSPREICLERQSQRLVEIADTASRARRDAECRSQAWADLMAQVSHELRTPLNAVIGFSDVMTAEIFGPVGHPRYREYVDHIRHSGQALLKSAEDTLVLTQILAQPGAVSSPAPVDLERVATEAWSFHGERARACNVEMVFHSDASLEVLADRRLVRQVLVNLFAEALSRAGTGAQITISASGDGDLVEIELAVRGATAARNSTEASLPLTLARALLDLHDAFLVELPSGADEWRVATMLTRAAQQDFFIGGRTRACAATVC